MALLVPVTCSPLVVALAVGTLSLVVTFSVAAPTVADRPEPTVNSSRGDPFADTRPADCQLRDEYPRNAIVPNNSRAEGRDNAYLRIRRADYKPMRIGHIRREPTTSKTCRNLSNMSLPRRVYLHLLTKMSGMDTAVSCRESQNEKFREFRVC